MRGDVAGPTRVRFGQHADRRTDLAGGAVATLERVPLNKGGLQPMKSLRSSEAFDSHDTVIVVHDRECQARVNATAVDQHRTRAALTVIATFLCAGETEMLVPRVEQ